MSKFNYFFVNCEGNISVILVLFNVGSKDEKPGNNGISHFLEHSLFLGSSKFDSNEKIYTAIDNMGAIINGFTYQHMTGYYIKVIDEYIEEAIELMGNMIKSPLLRAHDIESERNVVIEELNAMKNNTAVWAKDLFERAIFPGNNLSNSISGTKKTLNGIDKEKLLNYYGKYYCPENSVIIVVGSTDPIKYIKREFGDWTAKTPGCARLERGATIPVPLKGPVYKWERREGDQDNICMGYRLFGFERDCHARVVAQITNIILGGMLSSRLFTRLRHKDRLVYSINSYVQFFNKGGYILIITSADTININEVLRGIFEEIEELRTGLVRETELNKVKKFMKGAMNVRNENTFNIATYYGQQIMHLGTLEGLISINDFIKEVDKVNNEEIREMCKKYLIHENLLIVNVGENDVEKIAGNIIKK